MSKSGLFSVPILLLLATASFAQTMVPNFSANRTSGCAPLTVQFFDQTTGGPTAWNWDFGNGTLANVQNPVITYNNPGRYEVKLVVRNPDGTTGITKTDYIVVDPSPSASFIANLTTGCAPVDIQFSDHTTPNGGSITSWNWDFGDGTTSTQQNPVKSYTQTGFYNVTLNVVSSTGCKSSSSRSRYIRIVNGIKPQFEAGNAVTCRPPFPIEFKNQTAGPGNITYQWDLGNGVTSTAAQPSTTYNGGTFNVTLTATSDFGCSGTITKSITLDGPTMGINAPDTVCQNAKVFFRNTSSLAPESVLWDFGNGSFPQQSNKLNDSTVYPVHGDYTVKLINEYEHCIDSATKTIHVRRSPDIDFNVLNAESCKVPLTVTAQDASPATIVDWYWDFGDGATETGNPATHTYSKTGDFNVSVVFTDDKGCEGRISKPAVVKIQKPVVSIDNVPDGGCVPFTWTPDDNVQSLDGVVSWQWDFGDGGTATGQVPPPHVYSSVGTFDVKLTITTRDGCTESITYPDAIRVGTPPTVNFSMSANDICASEEVQFRDLSTPAATINRWFWDFGDGGTSTEQHPDYKFQDTGRFQVQLTAFNNGCPARSATQSIIVRPPIAKFQHTVICGTGQVNFTNQSIVDPALGAPVYSWDFGDGATSTAVSPSHTYTGIGTFDVTLRVTNGTCTDVLTEKVFVAREIPAFTISKNPACVNESLTFVSSNPPANVAAYTWSHDGGSTWGASDQDTVMRFSADGSYTITLQLEDVNGCVERTSQTLNIISPQPRFISNSTGGCTNTLVTFTDQSTPAASIRQWTFNFGDGQTQTYTTPASFTHQYRDTGSYVVKLTVQDDRGCTNTYTLPDTVFVGAPTAWFGSERDTICPTSAIQFIDSSKGKSLTYEWKFGDGNTSTQQNPTHTYGGNETTYNVQLIVRDRGGCADTTIRNGLVTTIKPKPAFDIKDTTTICPPIETKFTFQGAYYDSLYWDFGDGSTSSLLNPTHFYNQYGLYTAKLYLVGYGGCLDSASSPVNVYDPNTFTTWNYAPTDACNELKVDFSISTPPSTTFTFFFGDGTYDESQNKELQHHYKSPAFNQPFVLLYDLQDCQVVVGAPVTIRVIGAEPLFGVDRNKFCDDGDVVFTNYTIGNDPVVSRVWDFGDGTTSTEISPTHHFQQPGTFYVGHTVTTQTGCTKTIYDTIRVFRTPEPSILGDSVACIDQPVKYQGTLAVPDTAITWAWNIERINMNTQDILLNFPTSGDYVLRLQATNELGCTDSTRRNLYVPVTPEINIQTNPVTIPVTTGITLPVTYGENIDSYLWSPDKNLSCLDCPTPYANPKLTTTYKIKVQDIYGCTNQKDLTVNVVCTGLNYYLPNTFSPNGDGMNDVFAPRGNGLTRVNSMRIFNRWGEQVFEKMNFLANDRTPNGGWDGTFKGKPASPDVYVYIIEFVCENASVVPVRGNVALIR